MVNGKWYSVALNCKRQNGREGSAVGRLLALALAVAAGFAAEAQYVMPQADLSRSFSGQFLVQDQRPTGSRKVLAAGTNLIALDATVLTVSCERIKKGLWKRLGAAP